MELLLAITITVMVAAAITAMLGAVSTGAGSRNDSRSLMVLGSAANSRMASYVVPSRCVLVLDSTTLALWLDDHREGGTVHATEVRWLRFNAVQHTLEVHYVAFPSSWSQAARDLEDAEYPAATDWSAVLASYEAKGWTASQPLIDQLAGVSVQSDASSPLDMRHVSVRLQFQTDGGEANVIVASSIRNHQVPTT